MERVAAVLPYGRGEAEDSQRVSLNAFDRRLVRSTALPLKIGVSPKRHAHFKVQEVNVQTERTEEYKAPTEETDGAIRSLPVAVVAIMIATRDRPSFFASGRLQSAPCTPRSVRSERLLLAL